MVNIKILVKVFVNLCKTVRNCQAKRFQDNIINNTRSPDLLKVPMQYTCTLDLLG